MEINILRGQNQIGGSIIEISSKNTKIILDIGSNLDDKEIIIPEIEGLFKGKAKYDGILTIFSKKSPTSISGRWIAFFVFY